MPGGIDPKVVATHQRHQRAEKKGKPGFVLDPKADQLLDKYQLRRGKWIKSDREKDDDLKIRREYQAQADAGGVGPFGYLMADDKVFGYLKDKKKQEEYLKELQVANYLYDPEYPESQERMQALFPELVDVPQKDFMEVVTLQESLRNMIRDGTIKDKDDHALVMEIMKADFELPTLPLWDPDGTLIKIAAAKADWKLIADLPKPALANVDAVWKPEEWVIDKAKLEAYKQAFRPVKIEILKRLYPGLRRLAKKPKIGGALSGEDQLTNWYIKHFETRDAVVTDAPTEDKYLYWWDKEEDRPPAAPKP